MTIRKNILNLISSISDNNYKQAEGLIQQIIESKLEDRIRKISKNKGGKK